MKTLKNFLIFLRDRKKENNVYIYILKDIFNLLSKKDKTKIILIVSIQVLLGLLDLIGVGLIGVLGALSVSGIRSEKPGNRVSFLLNLLKMENISFPQQIILIGSLAAFFMVLKTLASMYFTKKLWLFLASDQLFLVQNFSEKFLPSNIPI